jgi:hypothetical protein
VAEQEPALCVWHCISDLFASAFAVRVHCGTLIRAFAVRIHSGTLDAHTCSAPGDAQRGSPHSHLLKVKQKQKVKVKVKQS